MVMICDYKGITDKLISVLSTSNTTTATYDLSNGLDKRVVSVTGRDPKNEPEMITNEFPSVCVKLLDKSEQLAEFGAGKADRIVNINYGITMVFDSLDKDKVEDNLFNLVRNVEVNVRENLGMVYNAFGASIITAIPTRCDFNYNINGNSPYNRSALLNVDIVVQLINYTGSI